MMSEDILSAISEQSDIPKAGSARKYVDTRIHGSNVEATDATCNSSGHADCYTGPFPKSSGPIVMDDLKILALGRSWKISQWDFGRNILWIHCNRKLIWLGRRRKISCWNFSRKILWRHCMSGG
jgi:hypothetical protein